MAISGVSLANLAKTGGTGWGNVNQSGAKRSADATRFPSTPVNGVAAPAMDPAAIAAGYTSVATPFGYRAQAPNGIGAATAGAARAWNRWNQLTPEQQAMRTGTFKPDPSQFNLLGPQQDMWDLAKQSGNYGNVLQTLDPAYVSRRYDEISARLANPGVYDPSHPFDGGLSPTAVQALQAEGDRYKAALDWQAANPNWAYLPPAR